VEEQRRGSEMRVNVEVVDSLRTERGGPPDEAVHLVALCKEEFSQVGPILPCDTCDECALCQLVSPYS
jgi:hypothetical protein